jgi:hypothetical protein
MERVFGFAREGFIEGLFLGLTKPMRASSFREMNGIG